MFGILYTIKKDIILTENWYKRILTLNRIFFSDSSICVGEFYKAKVALMLYSFVDYEIDEYKMI